MTDPLAVLDRRPLPGQPRAYDFPAFTRERLDNGLTVLRAHVPGRPLLQAQLIVRGDAGGGATSEPPEQGGVTVLAARAMSEGTLERDAVAFIEATERLGAQMGASAGWDSLTVQVEVPRTHLAEALPLFAELALQPAFPGREVARLRDERLNDLKQTMADAGRRADLAFPAVIYADEAAYARPAAGLETTVAGLDEAALAERHAALMRPEAATLVVCGDLAGLDIEGMVTTVFGGWHGEASVPTTPAWPDAARPTPRIQLIDRPAAPQSEIRIGHVGVPRRIDDFHALSVMNTMLGGLFNSRLNRLLREERGYTYGVRSAFDMRRGAGPFAVRCAVASDVTAPAVVEIMAELERLSEAPVEPAELAAARDYLVGVFPLRFETSAQVAGALAGLVVQGLPDDELDRYRPAVAAVSADDVRASAAAHIHPDQLSILVVGDVDTFAPAMEEAGLRPTEVVRGEDGEGADR
jgi:zinc protease